MGVRRRGVLAWLNHWEKSDGSARGRASGSPSAFRAGAAATGRLWLFRGDADLVGVRRTARHVEGQDAIGVGGPPRRGGILERLGVGRHGGEDLPRAARLALDLEAVFIAGVVFPSQAD